MLAPGHGLHRRSGHLLERCFSEDRPYPEKEVNQRLALFHEDVSSLRRYLVAYGMVTRQAGVYRRAAGAVSRE